MAKSGTSADNVLDILLLFDNTRAELTADEISARIDAPLSTTYRYIRILRDKGFLEKTASSKLCLGPQLLQLALTMRGRYDDIGRLALPVMEEIAAQTRETVLLTRLFGRNSVCVERVEGPQTIRITFERGQVQPLHAGASSKILLAYVDEAKWDQYLLLPLERFTDQTITDLDELKGQLRAIRQAGYCVTNGEVDEGALAVSVPILDPRRRLVAGLSTAGPAFRLGEAAVQHHLTLLRAGATTLQDRLAELA